MIESVLEKETLFKSAALQARLHAARTAFIYDSAIVGMGEDGQMKYTSGDELMALITQLKIEIQLNQQETLK